MKSSKSYKRYDTVASQSSETRTPNTQITKAGGRKRGHEKNSNPATDSKLDPMLEFSDYSNRNIATRSSTGSLPQTEYSRKLGLDGSAKSGKKSKHMDMPLQRNIDHIDVSPIMEDDKEDTQIGDYESTIRLSNRKRLFSSRTVLSTYEQPNIQSAVNKNMT